MMEKVSAERRRLFETLCAEHRLQVLAYCSRRLGGVDAADACSETFLVAWSRIDDIPPAPKTLPYLYGIARRVLSNQLRSLRRRGRLEEKLRNLGVAPPLDPSVVVARSSQDEEVINAIRKLKPRDREIVVLCA